MMKELNNEKKTKQLNSIEKKYEKELAENYKASRDNIKKELADLEQKGLLTDLEMRKKDRLRRLQKKIDEELVKVIETTNETLTKSQLTLYETAYTSTTLTIAQATATTIPIVIPTRQILRSIKNPLDKVGFIQRNIDNTKEVTKKLNQVITQGLIQGKGYADIGKKIDERFDVGFSNAVRIARTEGHRVREQGSDDARTNAVKKGINLKKKWLTARDEKVRDAHAELNGETIGINEKFSVDGHETDIPGGFGVPELDINCRCTLIEIVEY